MLCCGGMCWGTPRTAVTHLRFQLPRALCGTSTLLVLELMHMHEIHHLNGCAPCGMYTQSHAVAHAPRRGRYGLQESWLSCSLLGVGNVSDCPGGVTSRPALRSMRRACAAKDTPGTRRGRGGCNWVCTGLRRQALTRFARGTAAW